MSAKAYIVRENCPTSEAASSDVEGSGEDDFEIHYSVSVESDYLRAAPPATQSSSPGMTVAKEDEPRGPYSTFTINTQAIWISSFRKPLLDRVDEDVSIGQLSIVIIVRVDVIDEGVREISV